MRGRMDLLVEDEIIEIVECGVEETIDISVDSSDRLFFANDILTHNSGYDNSDVDLTNTSESMGITHTADAIFALITTEELDNLGQLMIKQLKNRWGDINYYRRFVIGIDRSKMKLYNLENSAQANISAEPILPTKPGKQNHKKTNLFSIEDSIS